MENVTVAVRCSFIVTEPDALTVTVVEVEVEELTATPPLVSHSLNLYPLGMFPADSECEPSVTFADSPFA